MSQSWPTDLLPVNCSFFVRHNSSVFTSPLTGSRQVLRRQGERWVGTASFRYVRAKGQKLDALLAKLKGSYDTVLVWDFARPTPLGTNRDRGEIAETVFTDVGPPTTTDFTDGTQFDGGDAEVTAWGGWAIGSEQILTDGWYPSEVVLKAGDYIGIGGKLYMALDDVTSSAIGRAYINITPRVQAAIAHLDVVTRTRPTAEMYLVDDDQPSRDVNRNQIYEYTLSFVGA